MLISSPRGDSLFQTECPTVETRGMTEAAESKSVRYTWDDYRTWPDTERWEIIGGEPFCMSPSPTPRHQVVARRLTYFMEGHFQDRACELFPAPLDVKLSDTDIVQPDLAVVCDPEQVQSTHIDGPPTLVVEIISPSSLVHDRVRKFQLYARAGVREYWIVTLHPALIEVFALADGRFHQADGFGKDDTLISPAFPELRIPLAEVFTFPLEPGEEVQEIRESEPPYGKNKI